MVQLEFLDYEPLIRRPHCTDFLVFCGNIVTLLHSLHMTRLSSQGVNFSVVFWVECPCVRNIHSQTGKFWVHYYTINTQHLGHFLSQSSYVWSGRADDDAQKAPVVDIANLLVHPILTQMTRNNNSWHLVIPIAPWLRRICMFCDAPQRAGHKSRCWCQYQKPSLEKFSEWIFWMYLNHC